MLRVAPLGECVDPALTEAPAANKPKALSAASGDWDIFDVLQSHILPEPSLVPFDAQ
jgi:hypothetical protein